MESPHGWTIVKYRFWFSVVIRLVVDIETHNQIETAKRFQSKTIALVQTQPQ
jgi:hypothetical protein